MKTITSIPQIRKISEQVKSRGLTIGFVPTMGYLHKGHTSLMEKARQQSDVVFISIFVNPIQFGPSEDFDKYPRDLEWDSRLATEAGVDYLFTPRADDIYSPSFKTKVSVQDLDKIMCGKYRPGHFTGVCTIVLKLFNIIGPHQAYFGQKDYQQLVIIRRMVQDLNLDIKIIAGETVREDDGLAVSSRNIYLDSQQRKNATVLYQSLKQAEKAIKQGQDPGRAKTEGLNILENNKFIEKIDYFDIRDAETLEPALHTGQKNGILIAAAVWLGKTRLIDNIMVK